MVFARMISRSCWIRPYPPLFKSSSIRISEEGRGRFGRGGYAQIKILLGSINSSSTLQTTVNPFKMKDRDAKQKS